MANLSVTIREPFQTPTLDSVSTSPAAGNWVAKTYEFKIFTCGFQLQFGQWRSALSNSKIVTVNANDSVTFNYTIPVETSIQPTRIVALGRESGSDDEWTMVDFVHSYGALLPTYPDSLIITSQFNGTNRQTIVDNFTIYGEEWYGIDTDKGIGKIEITGDTGILRLSDIISALNSSGMVSGTDYKAYGAYALYTNCIVDAREATGGILDLTTSTLYALGGITNVGSGMTIRASRSYHSNTIISCPLRGGYSTNINIDNSDMEGALIHRGTSYLKTLSSGPAFKISNGEFKDGMISSVYDTIFPDVVSDSIYYIASSMRLWESGTYDSMTLLCSNLYTRSDKYTVIKDCLVKTLNTTYQIFWLPNHETSYTIFRDTNFKNLSTGASIPYTDLKFYDYNLYNQNAKIDFEVSVNLKILDENENTEENVNVTLLNKNGDEVINNNTDSNGELSEYVVTFRHRNIKEETAGVGKGIDANLSPFTIILKKPGYETYKSKLELTEKTSLTITLKPVTPPIYIHEQISAKITTEELKATITEAEDLVVVVEESELMATISQQTLKAKITEVQTLKAKIL